MSIAGIGNGQAPLEFKAEWNEQLMPAAITLRHKIWRIVCNILTLGLVSLIGWCIGAIAKKVILPSAWGYSPWIYPKEVLRHQKSVFRQFCFGPIDKSNREFRTNYQVQRHIITTPDGARLNAYHFKRIHADPNTETLLFFQSNGSFTEQKVYGWLIAQAIKRNSNCNFVVFDYRGVVGSEGDAKKVQDLVVDGESAYQFVTGDRAKGGLGVDASKVRMHGWSLGGLISGNVKALHPECTNHYVNERSLGSLGDVPKYSISRCCRSLMFWIPFALKQQGWNLSLPLEQIKGRKMFIVHKDDDMIPYAASSYVAARRAKIDFDGMVLYQTPEQKQAAERAAGGTRISHHFEPLAYYTAEPGQTAADAVAEFILPPAAAAAERTG